MGPIGYQEMFFIFVLALLLFGPKKLPELGRTIGKAWSEFNRAKNDMKATFDREMRALERETESIKEVTNTYYNDSYNYDYSNYDAGEPHVQHTYDSVPSLEPSTLSASATEGAEVSHTGFEHQPALAGTVANGSLHHLEATDFAAARGEIAHTVEEHSPAD